MRRMKRDSGLALRVIADRMKADGMEISHMGVEKALRAARSSLIGKRTCVEPSCRRRASRQAYEIWASLAARRRGVSMWGIITSRKWRWYPPVGLVLFALFLLALVLHTLFDRLTPYTSEATLQAPVVGVAPNVSGTIVSVSVQDNQMVHAGDRLFRIDPLRYEAALQQAEANLSDAVQRVGASAAALSAAAAKVSDANANLTNERAQTARILLLASRDDASRAQADVARAKQVTAEAAVQSAEANLEEARRRLGPTNEDNPQIKLALAQYKRARLDLDDTDVKAPIDGRVTNTVLAPGQYASAGHTVATIVDTEAGWVVANLPENTLGNIRIGNPVLITFNVAPGQIVQGRVGSMASGVSQSAAAALEGPLPYVTQRRQWLREVQRIPVRIELRQQQEIPAFRVGSRANVVVVTEQGRVCRTARARLVMGRVDRRLCLLNPVAGCGSRSASPQLSCWPNCYASTCN